MTGDDGWLATQGMLKSNGKQAERTRSGRRTPATVKILVPILEATG